MIDWPPELHEEGADDEVMMQMPRWQRSVIMAPRALKEDRREHHGRDRGHGIGLEQVGCHASAVTDVVTNVVRDHRGIPRVVLGMPASTLPTRSAPTSAPLVKMPPPRRAKIEISEARSSARPELPECGGGPPGPSHRRFRAGRCSIPRPPECRAQPRACR